MPLFDDSSPANTESIKLGAERIREMKTLLNSTLGNLYSAASSPVAGSISTAMLANLAATTAKINDLAVTEGKIAAGAVTEAKIGALAVTTPKIANGAVDANKLASDAVTTAKILDGNVTQPKLVRAAQSVVVNYLTYEREDLVSIQYGSSGGLVATTNFDDSIPQITEGSPIITVPSYTMDNANNQLEVEVLVTFSADTTRTCFASLHATLGGVAVSDALAAAAVRTLGAGYTSQICLKAVYAPGSTSAVVFSVRMHMSTTEVGGHIYVNGVSGAVRLGGLGTRVHVRELKV